MCQPESVLPSARGATLLLGLFANKSLFRVAISSPRALVIDVILAPDGVHGEDQRTPPTTQEQGWVPRDGIGHTFVSFTNPHILVPEHPPGKRRRLPVQGTRFPSCREM